MLVGGAALALVSFADTSVLSRAYAARLGRPVNPNQEMVGLGAANLAAGLFQGFPISSSSSRTPVAEAAGAKTQVTGVVGALGVAALLVAAPDLLKHLPTPALAAVVIASAIGLIEVADLRRIWRIQRWEFWLSILCLVGVAVLGAVPGIGLAVVVAVIEFLWDGWRPHSAILGRAEGVRGWHDITRYPDARLIPGLLLFRWDAPLFFANAELFEEKILAAVEASPTGVRRVVVAAAPVTSVDVTAADALAELDDKLVATGIKLCFAELKDPVKDKLRRFRDCTSGSATATSSPPSSQRWTPTAKPMASRRRPEQSVKLDVVVHDQANLVDVGPTATLVDRRSAVAGAQPKSLQRLPFGRHSRLKSHSLSTSGGPAAGAAVHPL